MVTTNFDRLLEQAFESKRKNALTAATAWDVSKRPADASDVLILKLHGDISTPETMLVCSKSEDSALENQRRMLRRAFEFIGPRVELYVGFTGADRDALRLVMQNSISDRRDCRRIFLGSLHDETRREASPWFTRIHQSAGEVTTFVAAIVRKYAALSKHLSEDAVTWERVRYYQSLLQRELHYSWTIDRAKQIIVDEASATLSFATRSGPLRFPIASQSESGDDVGWAGPKTRADLLRELTTRRTTILAGEAGSGKTTLLKSIVRELARQPNPPLLPIFLGAHELANVRISTFRSILDSLAERTGVSGLPTALLESMKTRACLLVVDGLDELGRDRLNEFWSYYEVRGPRVPTNSIADVLSLAFVGRLSTFRSGPYCAAPSINESSDSPIS